MVKYCSISSPSTNFGPAPQDYATGVASLPATFWPRAEDGAIGWAKGSADDYKRGGVISCAGGGASCSEAGRAANGAGGDSAGCSAGFAVGGATGCAAGRAGGGVEGCSRAYTPLLPPYCM